jgi:hypothetical protein
MMTPTPTLLLLPGSKKKNVVTLAEHLARVSKLGGQARMKGLSKEERQALGKKGGKRGGEARARTLTPEQRSQIARRAALEMWRKRRMDDIE